MNLLPCMEKTGQIIFSGYAINTARKRTKNARFLSAPSSALASLHQPENIALCAEDAGHISGTIKVCEYLGSEQFAYIDCGFGHMVTVRVNPDSELQVGSTTGLSFDNEKLYVFDGDGIRLDGSAG